MDDINIKKRAGIYTPYDLVPGGGERYLLTIAEYLSLNGGYEVSLIFDEIYSRLRLKQMERELDVSLDGVKLTTYGKASKEAEGTGRFDVFLSMGNSLTPWINPLGRRNIYICQFPFPQNDDWIKENALTLKKYDTVIVYSNFVMEHYKNLLKKYGLPDMPVNVVYPPCGSQTETMKPETKNGLNSDHKIIILTVGRFFSEGHCKRQDFLIESFIEMLSLSQDKGLNLADNVELHIAGGIHPTKDGRDFFAKCKNMAQGHKNIFLYGNIDALSLKELYAKADIYWHAAGINVNSAAHPEMLEHFGITVVEAMAAGCIPIVVNKGGPPEIVRNGIDGFHFNSKEELIEKTLNLVKMEHKELKSLLENALLRSGEFTKEKFYSQISNQIRSSSRFI